MKNEYSNHAMICFYVPEPMNEVVSMPGGMKPDELHLTLAYLGKLNELPPKQRIIEALSQFINEPDVYALDGVLNGVARFNDKNDTDKEAFVLLYDSPKLPEFRQTLVDMLDINRVPYSQKHGFIPHITMMYLPISVPSPQVQIRPFPLNFSTVYLTYGDEKIAFNLREKPEPKKPSFSVNMSSLSG